MLVSIELVPRSEDALLDDIGVVRKVFPEISLLNIPDLLRFNLRSYQATNLISQKHSGLGVIPHIRAIDIAPDAPLPAADQSETKAVLVVAGDPPPAGMGNKIYENSSVDIIKRYAREAPHLDVYAVFDPYRRAPKEELEDIQRKKDAGACGFFTQPLFDINLLKLSMDWLRDETVFWGVSPVIGEKSRRYWERVNNIVFPKCYEFSLEGNIHSAREILTTVRQNSDNAYLMPLKIDLHAYLSGVVDLIKT